MSRTSLRAGIAAGMLAAIVTGCDSNNAKRGTGSSGGVGGGLSSTGGTAGGTTSGGGAGGEVSGTGGGTSTGTGGAAGGVYTARWKIDSTTLIAGLSPEQVYGNPQVTPSPVGDAVCFDGDDGLLLPLNPIYGMAAWTIQVLMRFDAVTAEALNQPRFLHIEAVDALTLKIVSRVTMGGRVTATNWYLDTFLLSGTESLTLADPSKVHPVGQWTWAALSYQNGQMRHFVDGVEDASGAVNIPIISSGPMSLGVRQNLMYWFKGCIRELWITNTSVPADVLQRP